MYISEELNLEGISKDDLSLEDLFLIVLLVVDHFFKLLIGSQTSLRRSNNDDPRFSDQEVITIALVGELPEGLVSFRSEEPSMPLSGALLSDPLRQKAKTPQGCDEPHP